MKAVGLFFLLLFSASLALAEIRVFPNPFSLSQALGGLLRFDGLEATDQVKIYTPDGIRVRSLGPASQGYVRWDGKDERGDRVHPGLYFYVIRGPQGVVSTGLLLVQK